MKIRSFLFSIFLVFLSCEYISENDSENIARFENSFFTKKDLLKSMQVFNKDDSVLIANNIINDWAIKKILTQRALLNLDDSKLQEIRNLAENFETNLLSETYLEALVNSAIDLEIDSLEIKYFFDINKDLFRLNEDIFKFVYVELPFDFSDTYLTKSKLRRFKTNDQQFLDSISFRFKSYSLDGKIWVPKNKLIQKFPFLTNYNYRSLKNYNFFQFKDSLSLYLIKIIRFEKKGDIPPLEYVLPTLKYISVNKRKKELLSKIKSQILTDALQNKKLEIY